MDESLYGRQLTDPAFAQWISQRTAYYAEREDDNMAITTSGGHDPQVYTVPEDVTETLPDGRTIQIAKKGTAMPLAQAQALGLVKVTTTTAPRETKETAPKQTKGAQPDDGAGA